MNAFNSIARGLNEAIAHAKDESAGVKMFKPEVAKTSKLRRYHLQEIMSEMPAELPRIADWDEAGDIGLETLINSNLEQSSTQAMKG